MDTYNQASLGDQVSKKMSSWMLILVAATVIAVFAVSFVQSRQMFLKQVASWTIIAPRQALTSLIDSDYLSIDRDVKFLESTGLFTKFCIKDNQQRALAEFGNSACLSRVLIPIKDDAGVVWGYYSYQTNFLAFILPFLIAGAVFFAFISLFFIVIKWRISSNLGTEFSRFNEFLQHIEILTKKIHHLHEENHAIVLPVPAVLNSEQVVINRAFMRLIDEIKKANQSIRQVISATEKKRFKDELTETALQVAHDIGSPLAVLEIIVGSVSCKLEEKNKIAIRNAAARIRDIAYSLLKKGNVDMLSSRDDHNLKSCNLLTLVNQAVLDKRMEFKNRENLQINFYYTDSSYGLFSSVKAADFSRIVSNIINNAVEALNKESGEINIKLFEKDGDAWIEIKDNGIGIPTYILEKLGERGLTYGKEKGHGLGLYHAKSCVAKWKGRLDVQSEINQGTIVSIVLPKSNLPSWFMPEMVVKPQQMIVIIDDDESIHALWTERFRKIEKLNGCYISLLHLYTTTDLVEFVGIHKVDSGNIIYLCDFEFSGSNDNGLDEISRLGIGQTSVLVTSRFFQDEIVQKCVTNNIKLLQKEMAWIIPIRVES